MKIDDLILFILEKSQRHIGVKKLNKLAFLLEFTHIFEFEKPLTSSKYAALPMGPVIDNYKQVFARMQKDGKIARNLKAPELMENYFPCGGGEEIEVKLASFLAQVLDRYQKLNSDQLEDLTHNLDSYNITMHQNQGKSGAIIDKDLGLLDYSLSISKEF